MNAKQLIAALLTVAATGAAFAQAPAPSAGLTRAEVTAEYLRARAAGELSTSDVDYPKMPAFVGTLTRAQVIAELLEARKNGEMPMSEVDFDVARTSHHVLPSSN